MEYKLLWNFLCDRCDNAGVWKIDFEAASFFIGVEIDPAKAYEEMRQRVRVLDPNNWLIAKFVDFQFGSLTSNSPLHKSVLKMIERHTLALGYPKAMPRVQVMVKVKDKVREEVKTLGPKFDFEALWAKYPRREGRKEAEKHFKASVVTLEDWLDIQNALDNYIAKLRDENTEPKFFKMGSTWFNNWKDYIRYQQPSVKPPRTQYVPPIPEKPMSDEDQKAGLEFVKHLKEVLQSGVKEIAH